MAGLLLVYEGTQWYWVSADQQHKLEDPAETGPIRETAPLMSTLTAASGGGLDVFLVSNGLQITVIPRRFE